MTEDEIKSLIEYGILFNSTGEKEKLNKLVDTAIVALGANPELWRYRYARKGVVDTEGRQWYGEWRFADTEDGCMLNEGYERQPLYTAPPVPVIKVVAYLSQHGDALTPGDFAGGEEEMHATAKQEGWTPLYK